MTNEQCIAIAELWRMDVKFEYLSYLESVEYQTTKTEGQWLKDYINSWSGFGRTVEAMLARGMPLNLTTPNRRYADFETAAVKRLIDNIIQKTHLAALEVVRQEKEDGEA